MSQDLLNALSFFPPNFILPYLHFLKIWQRNPNKDTWPAGPQPPRSRVKTTEASALAALPVLCGDTGLACS